MHVQLFIKYSQIATYLAFLDRFSEIERDNKHLLKKMKHILTSEDKFTIQEKDTQSKL